MSLRVRITFMNMILIGGILFFFGASVYGLVREILIFQIDESLTRAFQEIQPYIRINSSGELDITTEPSLDLTSNIFFQVWSRDGRLKDFSMNIVNLHQPLDTPGMQTSTTQFRSTAIGEASLRVLTVPLEIGGRSVGRIQIAQGLSVITEALNTLLEVMLIVGIVLIGLAGAASWMITQSALAPLVHFTRTALEITRTNDLTRRVPLKGPPDDEIGNLIQAFNQMLSRLDRMIQSQRRFLADVGHEFRTPLTVIRGNVDLMERMNELDEESVESIRSEVDRLTRLVGDLLLLAQIESGKLPLNRQRIELDSLVLEVIRQSKVLAGDRVRLKLNEIDQVQVCGDMDRLKQVFVNLLSNAIKYTPDQGQVVVSLAKDIRFAIVTVSDTGPGIPQEDLPNIFDRFYRGEKSRFRSKDGKGFGLGLSIAYWIVKNHNGRIEVDSKPGAGTTFQVLLPLAEGSCEEEIAPSTLSKRLPE
jgi:two-component system, OmpR family, sensor kinase